MNREFAIPETAFILHLFEEDTDLKSLNGYALVTKKLHLHSLVRM